MARESMKQLLMEVGGLTAGALLSKTVQNKMIAGMTFIPDKLKPAVSIAAGAALVRYDKNGLIGDVGRGMIADGGSSFGVKMIPGLSGITGDDMDEINDNVSRILDNVLQGDDDDDMGDDGLHDDLSGDLDDGLHDDLGDDEETMETMAEIESMDGDDDWD